MPSRNRACPRPALALPRHRRREQNEPGAPGCVRADPDAVRSTDAGSATWDSTNVVRGEQDRLSRRRMAGTLGAGIAAVVLVAGTIVALDARRRSSSAPRPPWRDVELPGHLDGRAGTTDWNTATNWSTGVPNGSERPRVHHGPRDGAPHRCVVLRRRAHRLRRQQPHHRRRRHGTTAASLRVSSGLENDGTLSGRASGSADERADPRRPDDQHGNPHRGRHRHHRRHASPPPSPMTAPSASHRAA